MNETDKRIIQLYRQGLSGIYISNKLKVTQHKVYSTLSRNKETRSNKENYALNFNDRYFKRIDTSTKAYFLGLIMADGCILEPKRSSKILKLELKAEDRSIIEQLAIGLGLKTERIREYSYGIKEDQISARLLVPSDILVHDLKQHGIHPRKTFLTKFPDIPNNTKKDFIRGYFDGDGCITVGPTIKIAGSIALLEEIQNILIDEGLIRKKTKLQERWPERETNIRSLEIGGRNQVKRIFDYLYKDSGVCLERKFNRFKELL